ncbi:hypothetical protein LCGC14_1776670 [marine sediment metagenome]|uniref:Uncharacterized protein n=1 Tax=marine sediment metagenome TaxID=412755 RepID=A0A0F9GWR6_9ZZZZ
MPREFSFEELTFDEKLAEEGVWFHFPDEASDFEIRIAHHDRPAYDRELARARRHYTRDILIASAKNETDDDEESLGDGVLDPELDRKITSRAMSRSIVTDWRCGELGNVARMSGGDLRYSRENAEKLLMEFTRLYQFVVNRAYTASHFRAVVEEDDAKN